MFAPPGGAVYVRSVTSGVKAGGLLRINRIGLRQSHVNRLRCYTSSPGVGPMSLLQANVLSSEQERSHILVHLEELLETPAFAGSRRRQAFLRYVVQETLEGRGPAIKETNIAVDVFGRSNDFDAQTASIVRVTAAEVRKRLVQAYEGGLGRDLRIELPLGGYQPVFHVFPVEETHGTRLSVPVVEPSARRILRPRWLIASVLVCAAAMALFLGLRAVRPPSSTDLLWRPFLGHDRPVLISLASPTMLYLANASKWLPLQPGVAIPTSEMDVMESSLVGTGGALGAALFGEQLASRGQRFELKFGDDMSFADLKHSPAILIGSSRWTRELTKPLRFKLQVAENQMLLTDSEQSDRNWSIPVRHRSTQIEEGYSLVTRLLQSEAGYAVLIVAGMDVRSTQAGVEFLSRNGSFDQFAKSAPSGWENKNFQVVLQNTIHGNSSGSVTVVASHFW